MKQKAVSLLLIAALTASMLTGCGNGTESTGNDAKTPSGNEAGNENAEGSAQENENAEESTDADGESGQEGGEDLAELTFGHDNWKIDMSYDYSAPRYKRFDGMEFTRIINTGGFDVPEGMTMDDNERVWAFQLQTGLTPKTLWSASGEAFSQKKSAAIASGEIPDLMEVNINEYYTLVKSGQIADLTDELLEGNHEGIQGLYALGDNVALETLKVDGRIYGLPQVYMSFDSAPLIWIRRDWMDKLNLEAPEDYGDLETIAKAFMEADFDGNGSMDTYGIPVLGGYDATVGGSGSLCDVFLNVGGAAPGVWQKNEDGSVVYGSLVDGAKDALTLLNDWYTKGIIPSDFATWDGETLKQIIGEDKAGIVFSPWWGCWDALSASINLNENAVWSAYMLPGTKGGKIRSAAGNPVSTIYVVRKDFEDPSAFVYAYDMLVKGYKIDGGEPEIVTNNVYNPMRGCQASSKLTNPMKDVMEKVFVTHEITTKEQMEEYVQQETDGILTGKETQYAMVIDYGLAFEEAIQEGQKIREITAAGVDAVNAYCSYVAVLGIKAIAYGEPEAVTTAFQGTTDSMGKYGSFLKSLETEAYTKMIMGDTDGKSISDYFDSFVEEYLSQGGAEITAEVQEFVGK